MTALLRPRMRALLVSFVLSSSLFVISASAQAAGLTGRVVDPDGRAVVNAEVIVSGPAATPFRARTGADGKFEVPVIDAGRYTVIASAPGLISDAQSIDVSSEPATIEIALHLSAVSETLVEIGGHLLQGPSLVAQCLARLEH